MDKLIQIGLKMWKVINSNVVTILLMFINAIYDNMIFVIALGFLLLYNAITQKKQAITLNNKHVIENYGTVKTYEPITEVVVNEN